MYMLIFNRCLIVVYRHLTKDYRLNYTKCKEIINEVYLTSLVKQANLTSLFITPLIPLISIDDYRLCIDDSIG